VQDTGIFIDNDGDQISYILNGGLIQSADVAIQGGDGREIITNNGNIQGKIFLGAGNDEFDNSGGTVDHAVDGGLGDDYYVFGATSFTIIDGGGNDTIATKITRSLTSDGIIENLHLIGGANINGTGNSFANRITGNDGNNILDGGADNVVDVLEGGKGDDTYVLGAGSDQVVENEKNYIGESGVDTVTSTISRSLTYGYVENLTLLGSGNINGEGNEVANVIIGNSGANILDGNGGNDTLNGGAGADTMFGGFGDDKFIVDNASDVVTETAGGGTADRVYASVSYQLVAGAEVEILNTTSNGGTGAINLVGNNFAQTIIGNAGNNIINGLGGIDTMHGLGGNDKYYVDNAADVVVETVGGGSDRVYASVNYALKSGVEVESLTTNDANATTALKLAGNAFANTIIGNAGSNFLNGAAGADTLTGLGGSDIFMFNTALGGGNVDAITDFNVADDTIRLDNAIFTAIAGTGVLTAAQFSASASGTAQDASDRIIYETDTGELIYDANGSAAGGGFLFTTLDAGLAITNADFFIV
jgi:Ca2+-binding RTX toxin-like protein